MAYLDKCRNQDPSPCHLVKNNSLGETPEEKEVRKKKEQGSGVGQRRQYQMTYIIVNVFFWKS